MQFCTQNALKAAARPEYDTRAGSQPLDWGAIMGAAQKSCSAHVSANYGRAIA